MTFLFKKAFVTGGAGFIGSHLVESLIDKQCEVVVIDDLSTGHMSNIEHVIDKIEFIRGDIKDHKLVVEASKGCDVIFHLAAVVSVQQTVDHPLDTATINELGTLSVFEAARKNRVNKIVFSSSSAVYGDSLEVPKHEEMNPEPASPYAAQKLTGEIYSEVYKRLYGMDIISLRYFNVYGPRQDPSSPYSGVISIFMSKAVNNEKPIIYGDGNQYRDFVFVKDVVQANILAASSGDSGGRVYNIGTGRYILINELWKMISSLNGTIQNPEYRPARSGDIVKSSASVERAGDAFGFKADVEFVFGLQKTYRWFKK